MPADASPLIDTARGPARLHLHATSGDSIGLVLLMHGAGTDSSRAPLPALADALAAAGMTAVRLDQPFTVAGRRAPDPAHLLDAVVAEVLPAVRALSPGVPLAMVGRSSGARVACRSAAAAGTRAIVALGFPWIPPAGAGKAPRPDRGAELRAGARACPVLVVQGDRDPFGMPPRLRGVTRRVVIGMAHTPSEKSALATVSWLRAQLAGTPGRSSGVGTKVGIVRREEW